ncbi:DUF664 domain-containing protein [Kitasatospora sp. NPDC051914]|uniref:mycothiol transferase n=1 Tax=Kitasatospora sp. NPDC051914 TaxID=3154945 RepID=UPI00344A9F79
MTARTDVPAALDERTQLVTFLDCARATARAKCEGVSAENARRAPLPGSPLMTLAGLVNHLRWVEHWWLEVVFLGREDEGSWTEEDPDREMRIAVDVPHGRPRTHPHRRRGRTTPLCGPGGLSRSNTVRACATPRPAAPAPP